MLDFVLSPPDLIKRYGQGWAIVTGATDGIGKEFCIVLAKRGFNICLVCRNQEKANLCIKQLLKVNQKIKTFVIIVEFQHSLQKDFFNNFEKQLQNLEGNICLLVNNVGIAESYPLNKIDEKHLFEIIQVNCASQALVTRKVIPILLKQKNRSGIINISSMSADICVPYLDVYSATKAFNDSFSKNIAVEYSDKIDCISYKPGYVKTQMSAQRGEDTNKCVESCLKQILRERSTNGVYAHKNLYFQFQLFPRFLSVPKMRNDLRKSYERRIKMQQDEQKK